MHSTVLLPHHKLHAFRVCTELLVAVRQAGVRDAHLRDQAMRAAQSACLNCAEGAARVTRADKARVFAIARAEACEAAAAVEIAALSGTAAHADSERVAILADRVVAMLTRLIR
jgi:four helix bundle protein